MSSNDHFNTELAGTPTADGRFVKVDDIDPIEFVDGLEFRPVLTERSLVNFVHFDKNTEAPRHSHEEEQTVIVLEGEFEFDLDGDVRTLRPGDVAVVPAWVPHGAHTNETTCLEVDVFTPPRKSLLEHAAAQIKKNNGNA
ncbi:MAG TPA: cupin domain-containing protein [Acidimicrobiales bacterium]|jgi:quercetin dioxygenase-like cupin family protein|nr:cupin domain-containing protein [Acidimicrobiales bacterium]